jgi:hypothetical protein
MLTRIGYCGSGEGYCKTSSAVRVDLNNVEVSPTEARALVLKLQKHFSDCEPIRLEFSNRRPRRTWGSAWIGSRRIKLYRHSVGVLLHEVAHLLTHSFDEHHGRRFATLLDECIKVYQGYQPQVAEDYKVGPLPKVELLPVALSVPQLPHRKRRLANGQLRLF